MSMDMKGMKHSPKAHYQMAETLLAQGEDAHRKLSETADARNAWPSGTDEYAALTRQMDEYGKKCIGTWLQAQVHATLATVDAEA